MVQMNITIWLMLSWLFDPHITYLGKEHTDWNHSLSSQIHNLKQTKRFAALLTAKVNVWWSISDGRECPCLSQVCCSLRQKVHAYCKACFPLFLVPQNQQMLCAHLSMDFSIGAPERRQAVSHTSVIRSIPHLAIMFSCSRTRFTESFMSLVQQDHEIHHVHYSWLWLFPLSLSFPRIKQLPPSNPLSLVLFLFPLSLV